MAYIDGVVCPVPNANKDAYLKHAELCATLFKDYGALAVNEGWGDVVPDGKVTSFPMAVKCEPDETVCFSWVVWPSKQARDEGWEKIMADPRMSPDVMEMPFDGKRIIYGSFELILEA